MCCSLYDCLHKEPRLATLIPCCPTACVLQNSTKALIHMAHKHTDTCSEPLFQQRKTSPEALNFLSSGWNQSNFLMKTDEQLLLFYSSITHLTLSLTFSLFHCVPFSLSLNTFGLTCLLLLLLIEALRASQHCCCLEETAFSLLFNMQ